MCCGVGEAEDEAEHSRGFQKHAGNVQLKLGRRRLPIEQDDAADECHAGEDEIDVERATPREILGQCAAEEQADRTACRRDRAVDAERLGPATRCS
jgi:hypothetical protein